MKNTQQAQHTPGPWQTNNPLDPCDGDQKYTVYGPTKPSGTRHPIATVYWSIADAQLIARAPTMQAEIDRLTAINAELREALKHIALHHYDAQAADVIDYARSTLARAAK